MANCMKVAKQWRDSIMNARKSNFMTSKEAKELYISQLFTQLILSGLSCSNAAEKANEAAVKLESANLPFPTIVVG